MPRLHALALVALGAVLVLAAGCNVPKTLAEAVLPDPPPYPDYADARAVDAEARRISDALEAHVVAWLDGRAPARIPDALLPPGFDRAGYPNVRLVRPEDVTAASQWVVRPAQEIDRARLRGLYPDPHCTYLVPAGPFFLPFGAKAVINGEFPHARFFSVQVSPPFDPAHYYYEGRYGAPEVPLVDVDIDPAPGHTNPFRPGADRTARRRSYRVELVMAQGDAVALEPGYRTPDYRAPGNRRFGSGIVYQGPMARPGFPAGHGRGVWGSGAVWLRYYAPDDGRGPLAGVPVPKIHYELADGRRFYLASDSEGLRAGLNREFALRETAPTEPAAGFDGPGIGWTRDLGIFHGGIVGLYQGVGKTSAEDKAEGQALVLGVSSKGADRPAPGDYVSSASRVPHITYLGRSMAVGRGKVFVLAGRLPTTPDTRDGQRRMGTGQARYWSVTSYPEPDVFRLDDIGAPLTSLMDDEIVTDDEGNYVVVYSRPEDRPANATAANGVTWADWGPVGRQQLTIRWLTVAPDWKDRRITLDDAAFGYAESSWLSPQYDPSVVGRNDRSGRLGPYQPVLHYLTTDQFEALGRLVTPDRLPRWE